MVRNFGCLFEPKITMKLLICGVITLLLVNDVYCAMSETQLKAAMKLVRNLCQPKFKTTDEQIEAMHKGDWNQDKSGQCYMWCIIHFHKMMGKDNSFTWETALNMINNQAPESIRPFASKAVEACKDAVKTPDDKCAAGFEIGRCVYMADPEHYFLP